MQFKQKNKVLQFDILFQSRYNSANEGENLSSPMRLAGMYSAKKHRPQYKESRAGFRMSST
jgi:hypothetical protein